MAVTPQGYDLHPPFVRYVLIEPASLFKRGSPNFSMNGVSNFVALSSLVDFGLVFENRIS